MSVAMAAEDLRALAWLHEMERAPAVLAELHRSGFPQTLSLLPPTHDAVTQMAATLAAIADTTQDDAARCTDDLAADYAGIYITHATGGTSPTTIFRTSCVSWRCCWSAVNVERHRVFCKPICWCGYRCLLKK